MNWKPFRWNGMVLLIKLHIRRWWSFLNNINLHSDRWIQCYNLINIWLATWNSFHSSRNGSTLFFDKYDFNAICFFLFSLCLFIFVIRVQSESFTILPCSVGEHFFIAWFVFNVGSIDSFTHLLKSAISSDKCNKSLTLSSEKMAQVIHRAKWHFLLGGMTFSNQPNGCWFVVIIVKQMIFIGLFVRDWCVWHTHHPYSPHWQTHDNCYSNRQNESDADHYNLKWLLYYMSYYFNGVCTVGVDGGMMKALCCWSCLHW